MKTIKFDKIMNFTATPKVENSFQVLFSMKRACTDPVTSTINLIITVARKSRTETLDNYETVSNRNTK
jgi:hypothetical protein